MEHCNYTIFEHIAELRRRIITAALIVIILSAAGYFYYDNIIALIIHNINQNLYTHKITEAFITKIQVSLLAGIFFAVPVIIYQITAFVFPALKKENRALLILLIMAGFILFLCGIWFSYQQIIPLSIAFLTNPVFFPAKVDMLLNYGDMIKFVFQMLIGFGLAFQTPILLIGAVKLRLIDKLTLLKISRYAIVLIFIISAILTPPDWISQVMLAVPLIALYFLAIAICYIFKVGD